MVAKAIMIGNLGNTPELKYAGSGTAVCNLRLAVNSRGKGGVEETDWFDVACFGKTAEAVAQYCDKGSKVYVEGRLKTREFEDKNKQKQKRTEVIADSVQFLSTKGDKARGAEPAAATGPNEAEDLPF